MAAPCLEHGAHSHSLLPRTRPPARLSTQPLVAGLHPHRLHHAHMSAAGTCRASIKLAAHSRRRRRSAGRPPCLVAPAGGPAGGRGVRTQVGVPPGARAHPQPLPQKQYGWHWLLLCDCAAAFSQNGMIPGGGASTHAADLVTPMGMHDEIEARPPDMQACDLGSWCCPGLGAGAQPGPSVDWTGGWAGSCSGPPGACLA